MPNFYHRCLPLLLLALLAAACQGEGPQQEQEASGPPNLREVLPGTWESVSIRVQVNSFDNTDSSYVFEVKEEDWVRRLGTRPVRMYFQADNKYRQEFTGTNDSLLSVTRGIWNNFSDTLMLIEPNATYQYTVSTANGLAEFRTLLDWDGDGQEDDEFLGRHRKVSMATE